MLPGLFIGPGMAAAAHPITWTVGPTVAQANGGGTITMPAGIAAGDLIVVCDSATNTNSTAVPTNAVPAGWTQAWTATGSNPDIDGDPDVTQPVGWRITVSYKVADGTEGAAAIAGWMNDNSEARIIFVYTPDRAIKTVAASVALTGLGSQVVTAGAAAGATVAIGVALATASPGWTAFSPAADNALTRNSGYGDMAAFALGADGGMAADVTMDPNANAVIAVKGYLEVLA